MSLAEVGGGTGLTRDALEAVVARTPFAGWIDALIEAFEPGRVALSVPWKAELTMHHGFAHGAVIGFLADSACAWAAASLVGDVVTLEYKLNLIAPAVGDSLYAVGEVLRTSGRHAVCRADVFARRRDRSDLVATALATIARFK
ncbi:thioesterase [Burkholderia ubonensis]|nr:PaaI family thioesterase [Burkholderia ubonensis]AYZ64664.1 PaaI family thioesterase [Burkholderia multivorans]AOI68041.1 thioesterase [Burkholderia ubonensis]KUZ23000.1 thioesterase [Burkholderia ubonensis]KUZ24748.1 thioesterase [Burkholderia ubonensis]KUZ36680.1 thioesterase [Burkholderia ubonensis]